MTKTWWLARFLLVCLCKPGFTEKDGRCEPCGHGYYVHKRSGGDKCERCTQSCSAQKNLIEVSACTETTQRECRCKPGFFCRNPTQITCRKDCMPCEAGTFSSSMSLIRKCWPYTDCAKHGKVVITEGSSTQDLVCGLPTTTSTPTPTTEPRTTFISTTTSSRPTTASTTTPTATTPFTPTSRPTTASTVSPAPTSEPMTSSGPVTVLSTIFSSVRDPPSTVTPVLAASSHQTASERTEQPIGRSSESTLLYRTTRQEASSLPRSAGPSSTSAENNAGRMIKEGSVSSWIFILLLVVFSLLVLTCLPMLCKGKILQSWPGLTFGKYQLQHLQKPQQAPSSASTCHSVETSLPLGSDIPNSARGQGMGPGLGPNGNQQVTMDYSGKGESINNTVGSIFIYSPGMVILGSNSNERKDEESESGEDIPLMSIPQQESSLHPQNGSVGAGMQEEFGKELSFPVPATSK